MYSLKSYNQVDVQPSQIMYHLKTYHDDDWVPNEKPTTSNGNPDNKLSELLQESISSTSNLVNELTEFFKKVSVSENFESASSKKKKEELNKNKLSQQRKSTELPNNDKEGKSFDGHSRGHAIFRFKLEEYEKVDGKLDIIVGPSYLEIVKLLKSIADGRNVGHKLTITEDKSTNLKATFTCNNKKEQIDKASEVLLTMGEIIGVYSKKDAHLSKTPKWLLEVDNVLSKNSSNDQFIRSLSKQLGPFDLLNKTIGITVADIVAYCLIKTTTTFPNNVEMFVKRISEVVTSA